MLYRSGYSYKDPGQERILALELTHSAFQSLLGKAVVSTHDVDATDSGAKAKKEGRSKSASVRVQWDPERTIKLDKLSYRNIQIGIPGALVDELVEGTVRIEDVTERARQLKGILDGPEEVDMANLLGRGQRVFEVDDELRNTLKMDENCGEGVGP